MKAAESISPISVVPEAGHTARQLLVAKLALLRNRLAQARTSLGDLRHAAEDAASNEPTTTLEALQIDVNRYGHETDGHLQELAAIVEQIESDLRPPGPLPPKPLPPLPSRTRRAAR